jgi:hypothetical protein
MFRYKTTHFSSIFVIFLATLTLSLPFVHLHPRLTHADDLGEHTHSGVIHTIFSSEDTSKPLSSADSLNSESSVELFRTAIDLNLFTQRPSADTVSNVLTAAWVSSDFFLLPVATSTTLIRNNVSPPPSSWAGFLPSLRAPPNHSFV